MKIVLCGPPRSGKSCLREGLKQAIKRIPGAPYPYVITACPDGEGAWFQETANRSPEEARRLKEEYKASLSGFSPEFVKRVADSVVNCQLPLTLVDIGGIPSVENKKICKTATHAIILAGDMDKVPEWRAFCSELGLKIIAEIFSDYHGQEDTVHGVGKDGIFRGSIHYLERGEDVSQRPCVVALAQFLVRMATAEEK
ncbi:hypothetical protein J7J81_01210 [bacterium]|nr:hypothetical protein [bacterium]